MNIYTVNAGNSRISIAKYEGNLKTDYAIYRVEDIRQKIPEELFPDSKITVAVTSVNPQFSQCFIKKIKKIGFPVYEINWKSKLNFINNYKTPETLGNDRIANLAGAVSTGKLPCLIIDAGTAVTVDLVNEDKQFSGGLIFPGRSLQSKALHSFTAQLPLIEPDMEEIELGCNTVKAINQGINGVTLFGIEGIIEKFKNRSGKKLEVIFTGGDKELIDELSHWGNYIPDLTHLGTKLIFELNKY